MGCAYFCPVDHERSYVKLDKFLLSKGHASIGLDIALEHWGVLNRTDLYLHAKPGGRLGSHPDFGFLGIEAFTASLAHGMGLAVDRVHSDRNCNASWKGL